ncbi:hypothetical protein [Massilia sp. BKSP1R2A-1]|uniref:hypothetical protein n=1 Tax=Massilia sp. BKSP1R2A-1 TaxID=3422595 RepID=UPI003D34827B
MAITKQSVDILAATSVPAGTTSAAPVTGNSIDVRALNGGEWGYRIVNGASAPGVAATLVLQTSHDGATWFDYQVVSGNLNASGVFSGSVPLGVGVMYARAIAYGNTTNGVTVSSVIQGRVG